MSAQQVLEALDYLDWQADSFHPASAPDKVVPFHQTVYRQLQPDEAPGNRYIYIIVYPATVRVIGEQSYGTGFDYREIFQVFEDRRELWRGSHDAFLRDIDRILDNASHTYLGSSLYSPDSPW